LPLAPSRRRSADGERGTHMAAIAAAGANRGHLAA
jgi:hypothetical protein